MTVLKKGALLFEIVNVEGVNNVYFLDNRLISLEQVFLNQEPLSEENEPRCERLRELLLTFHKLECGFKFVV